MNDTAGIQGLMRQLGGAGACKSRKALQGGLREQDVLNVVALGAAELFRVLPCGWNKQLCRHHQNSHRRVEHPLWRNEYQCLGDTWSLAHGNCDGNDKIMAVSKAPSLCQAQGLEWTV